MLPNPQEISRIAEKLLKLETNREKLGRFLREIKNEVDIAGGEVLEQRISYPVEPWKSRIKVCAIDGGISQNSYHGLDIVVTRAVSVVAEYENGKLLTISYYPSSLPPAEVEIISDPFTDEEFNLKSSLIRQEREIRVAIEAGRKFSPDIILLDGSIVLHPSSKPAKTSPIYENYKRLLEVFKNLYSLPYLIAGCSEDSRGRKFCNLVSEKILSKIDSPLIPELKRILFGTRDTNLLFHVLEKNERTCIFSYGETPVTKDLGEEGKNIYSFYLRPAEFDRPLRIDFYAEGNPVRTGEKIASMVLSLCCHASYAFPAPLVEADLRAKLAERDVEIIHKQLVERTGMIPSLLKLRREVRPF